MVRFRTSSSGGETVVVVAEVEALRSDGERHTNVFLRSGAVLPVFEPLDRVLELIQEAIPTDNTWRNTLSYAATALEGSADSGDRYAAAQIRARLRNPTTQGETHDV